MKISLIFRDTEPIEALQSTGANESPANDYVGGCAADYPNYIAFTMYRWDIIIRMSRMIGFVGGGAGFLLQ